MGKKEWRKGNRDKEKREYQHKLQEFRNTVGKKLPCNTNEKKKSENVPTRNFVNFHASLRTVKPRLRRSGYRGTTNSNKILQGMVGWDPLGVAKKIWGHHSETDLYEIEAITGNWNYQQEFSSIVHLRS